MYDKYIVFKLSALCLLGLGILLLVGLGGAALWVKAGVWALIFPVRLE